MPLSLLLNKNVIIGIVVASAIAGLYLYIHSLKTDIQNLKLTVAECKVKYVNEQRQSELLRNSLYQQSEKIERLRTDKEKLKRNLEEWKTKPPKIKYKVITKIREIKSDDCKDIKAVIDSVRNLDHNSLY